MRGAAVLCPSCGAGLEEGLVGGAVRCRHAGATRALDASLRRNDDLLALARAVSELG